MPDLWIADIPEDVFGALQTLARSAKGAEEVWVREYIIASLRVYAQSLKSPMCFVVKASRGVLA